jgi:hypothetical protein
MITVYMYMQSTVLKKIALYGHILYIYYRSRGYLFMATEYMYFYSRGGGYLSTVIYMYCDGK